MVMLQPVSSINFNRRDEWRVIFLRYGDGPDGIGGWLFNVRKVFFKRHVQPLQ